MKNKTVKKIQKGGWTYKPYKYIRKKVKSFDDEAIDTNIKKRKMTH